ncbi:nuclease A inhibitor family protein [Calothrix sp. NIES-4071]|nr:nuclease A inhibitor family protein [Calothrix sp. NIES-4071]BAZ58072.1 nuclease A inhibitor family protein [Calothrix sp. NIES-4105]
MKPETEKLLASLEVVSEGLYYPSESQYPYEPFVWDSQSQGEFSFIRVLEGIGYIQTIDYESLIQNLQNKLDKIQIPTNSEAKSYSKLIDEQKTYQQVLQILEIFQPNVKAIKTIKLNHPISDSMLIIGQTQEDDWVGISTAFEYQTCRFGEPFEFEKYSSTAAARNLINILEPLLAEQKYSSYNDLSCLTLETALIKDKLLLKLLVTAGYIEIWQHQSFEEEKNSLDRFLLANLQDVLTYVFCFYDGFTIYTIGKTPENDFLGVHTVGIWT